MDITTQITKEQLMYVALIGAGLGLLLGLIPLILGIRKGRLRLGILAIVLSAVGGALSVLISLVIVAIFIWLILRKGSGSAPGRNGSEPQ